MTNTKLYISRMDLCFRYPKIDTLIVTEENEQSRVYLYDNRSNIAYIPYKSFTWGMLTAAPMNQELKLSIPDYLEIDVECLNNKGINKHIKSVVVRTEGREYEYSREEFCQYFSRKLVYHQDEVPNRKYRLKPITEVKFRLKPFTATEVIIGQEIVQIAGDIITSVR